MMIFKSMLTRRSTLLTLIGLPVLILLVVLPFVDQTKDDAQVTIDVVDVDNQPYVKQVVNRMDDREPFSLNLHHQLDLDRLARGDVEAVFVVDDQLKKKIKNGETENILKWYRHEHSLIDGLFKEYLASALMEDIVRSEAANMVMNENESANWDEIYEYGDQFFRPEPLFQMSFESYESNTVQVNDTTSWPLVLVWAYILLVIVFFTSWLYDWRHKGIMERLSVFPFGKVRLHLVWLSVVLIMVLCAWLGFVTINEGFKIVDLQLRHYSRLVFVSIITLVLTWLASFIIRSHHILVALATIYTVVGLAVVLMVEWQVLADQEWYRIWLPFWIVS